MSQSKQNETRNTPVTWVRGGAALSLGWAALSIWRGRPRAALFGFAAATAFLKKLAEIRLRARVRRLLADPSKWNTGGAA